MACGKEAFGTRSGGGIKLMKTIFRSTFATLIFAAIIALGAAATFAQDPCTDAEGQTKLGDEFRAAYPNKDIPGREKAIELGKQFVEKYGACPSTKELSDYLNTTLPKMDATLQKLKGGVVKDALVKRFNAGLTSKNWDEVYAAGKALRSGYGDEFIAADLVMGSIGLDETAKTPRVTKWNDDTLKYAKLSLSELESNKITVYGINPFSYKNKDDAVAWMNYTIGYILSVDKNNKKEGASYLYKAAQATASDTRINPTVYQTIGVYYFDDAKKQFDEVNALIAAQSDKDTPEVKQQKVDAIKVKVGILNGTSERALDAYSRAWSLAPNTPAGKAYRDGLYKTIGDLYKVRFQKADGLDAWVKAVPSKPLPDPTSAIAPINDPEPTTTTSTTVPTPATPVAPSAKPAATTKPAAVKPAPAKPQSINAQSAAPRTTATTAKPGTTVIVKKKPTR